MPGPATKTNALANAPIATSSAAALVTSFAARVAPDCRLLILGTAPSLRSLELGEAYAHPQNLFWPFMGELFDAGPQRDYPARLAQLYRHGVGIWDVLQQCERQGSLDRAIARASEVPNALPELLDAYPRIGLLAFNGGKAFEIFQRHLLPHWNTPRLHEVQLLTLPSTSPANASMKRADKRRRWQQLADYLALPGASSPR